MTEKTNQNVWLGVALILVVLIAGLFIASNGIKDAIAESEDVPVIVPTAQEIADLVVIPEIEFPEYDFSGDYVISKAEYEDTLIEKEAEKLVLEEINSRDFKKAVFDALVDHDESIESYKDITEIVIKDIDVVVLDEEATVEVDLKVYYYVDGDEDEDFRARLEEFDFTVDNLIVEDEFEDAEVEYLDLVINKVY